MIEFANGYRKGNTQRIQRVMKKAEQGQALCVGFIGGSITQGAHASTDENCYAYRVFQYFYKTFPNAHMQYINAGIGGTTSHFACGRAASDLLSKSPDFILVEFSVNDESSEFYKETFEGLIRQLYYDKSKPAIMIFYNMFYQDGRSAERVHSQIARHYNLPAVSLHSLVYPSLLSGEIKMEELTGDGLHPNDKGHEIIADSIVYVLDQIRASLVENDVIKDDKDRETIVACENKKDRQNKENAENTIPSLTPNRYETSIRYQNYNMEADMHHFIMMDEEQANITDCFKKGWRSTDKTAYIEFEVYGSEIAIQYRRFHDSSAQKASVMIDGQETGIILDGNFDEDWGDKLELTPVLIHGARKRHIVKLMIDEKETTTHFFELISIICA